MKTYIAILVVLLGCASNSPTINSEIDVEIVYTPVHQDEVDIYLLVGNPNDFPILIPPGPSSYKMKLNGMSSYACGSVNVFEDKRTTLGPNERRLFVIRKGCRLRKGVNTLEVIFGGKSAVLGSSDTPYAISFFPDLETKILNEESSTSN